MRDQRELIKVLAAEKNENEKRHERLLKAIAEKPTDQGLPLGDDTTQLNRTTALNVTAISKAAITEAANASSPSFNLGLQSKRKNNLAFTHIDLPPSLRHHYQRMHHHSELVQNLLSEIKSFKYDLDHGTRDRMHSGILKIHWDEWAAHRRRHRYEYFQKILEKHVDVVGRDANIYL